MKAHAVALAALLLPGPCHLFHTEAARRSLPVGESCPYTPCSTETSASGVDIAPNTTPLKMSLRTHSQTAHEGIAIHRRLSAHAALSATAVAFHPCGVPCAPRWTALRPRWALCPVPIARKRPSRHARSRPGGISERLVVCAVTDPGLTDYWSETAPDMLTFATSGPGWAALFALVAGLAAVFFTYFEAGPRRTSRESFLVRARLSGSVRVELPSGVSKSLRANEEVVLREDSLAAADAVARAIEAAATRQGCEYSASVYKASAEGLSRKMSYPRIAVTEGSTGWVDGDAKATEGSLDALWDEYSRVGESGPIEKEWRSVMNKLGGVRRETNENACRLCNGTGVTKCSRCMGLANSGKIECSVCKSGSVPCPWCQST